MIFWWYIYLNEMGFTMNILVAGGAGFVGSNFIRYLLNKYPHYHIVNYDLLTYPGNLENLTDIQDRENYAFVKGNITNRELVRHVVLTHHIDVMVNFAAESHVDRSIVHPEVFVQTNVVGTKTLLDVANEFGISKFVQISTDEVYGSLGETGYFSEESPMSPNSPYAASKAGADLLVLAYFKTYGLHVNISRCSNNYGPYQYPEKLIPLMITNALEGRRMPIYGDGGNVRDWLHVHDHCKGVDLVIHYGRAGEIYNIGGDNEWTNNEIVHLIIEKLGVSKKLIEYVPDRLGHDYRYASDPIKIMTELGWQQEYSFETGINETIEWYRENGVWWKSGKRVRL